MKQRKTQVAQRKLYSIFCPYCMASFQANNVVFRKPIRPDGKDEMDDPYIQMFNNYYYKDIPFRLPKTIDPAYILSESDKEYDSDGMLVMVRDVEGDNVEARGRICPYCHNRLAGNAGKMKAHVLSVVGFKGSGKTTYEAALIAALGMDHVGCINVSVCRNPSSIEDNIIRIREGEDVNSTQTEEGPFHYEVTFNHPNADNFLLNMVDLPGEVFRNVNAVRSIGHAIPNSDTCIFLVDLEKREEARTVFGALVGNYANRLRSGDVNVAVVLYKADKLMRLFPKTPEFLTFRQQRDYVDCAPVSLERIKNNHEQIVKYVVERDAALSSLYTSLRNNIPGDHLRWFAAFSRQQERFAPNNVEEPLLWSLAVKGMYPVV